MPPTLMIMHHASRSDPKQTEALSWVARHQQQDTNNPRYQPLCTSFQPKCLHLQLPPVVQPKKDTRWVSSGGSTTPAPTHSRSVNCQPASQSCRRPYNHVAPVAMPQPVSNEGCNQATAWQGLWRMPRHGAGVLLASHMHWRIC